jgi:hypothetical protein
MSLWTPDGERPVSRATPAEPSASQAATAAPGSEITPEIRQALAEAGLNVEDLSPEQLQEAMTMMAEMAAVRQELLSAPASAVIANHLMGMYELAAIHLGENPPNFAEAPIAIEALRAVLERLAGAFGEQEAVLRQALGQLQTAFVQLKEQVSGSPDQDLAAEH